MAGSRAGCVSTYWGYHLIKIEGKLYRSSRLAHLYMLGTWPPDVMDHDDLDRENDAWWNLVPMTQAENLKKSAPPTPLVPGVKRKCCAYVARLDLADGTTIETKPLPSVAEAQIAHRVLSDLLGPYVSI
jgi:hypothetical protein